jgi:hypothetical protein
MDMNSKLILVAIAALGVIAADPTLAQAKHRHAAKHHHAKARCVDQNVTFSWDFIWTLRPDPQPNGCAPPVYDAGRYLGQDPDPNIRHQLRRDPDEYYTTR